MSWQAEFKPDFEISRKLAQAGTGAVIEVRGELDSGTCEELLSLAADTIRSRPSELTLDLRRMTFVDSAGTRALIMVERLAAEGGVPLVMTPAPEHVTELLRIAGLTDRIELHVGGSVIPPGGTVLERVELELPRDPHSPARGRHEVKEAVAAHAESRLSNIVLLTSELVTNAVIHPRVGGDGSILLSVTIYEDRVRVEVEDPGEGFRDRPAVGPEDDRGRGLFIVERFSDRWGSERVHTDSGPRFRVWFEVQLDALDEAAATGADNL